MTQKQLINSLASPFGYAPKAPKALCSRIGGEQMRDLIDKLHSEGILSREEFIYLLNNFTQEDMDYTFSKSRDVADKHFGKKIYVRGLIEFTNYCKNDCYYCGIRKSNTNAQRYRLSKEEILTCCENGYELGFRTFVLQGGEDLRFSDEDIIDILSSIKMDYPDCAITLSIGEKTIEQYKKFFEAGADRYLLRHETANADHYAKLHPKGLTAKQRQKCLADIKKIGLQTGAGFMIGSPYQTIENIADDLLFIKELSPHMIGVGPFIPHKDTPFANFPAGRLDLTLLIIAILRLMLPNALIPSTTALGTINPNGREMGIMAGANVVMPNLSPVSVRKKYMLYDNKICTGEEASECRQCLQGRMKKIGYELAVDRGDFKPLELNLI